MLYTRHIDAFVNDINSCCERYGDSGSWYGTDEKS